MAHQQYLLFCTNHTLAMLLMKMGFLPFMAVPSLPIGCSPLLCLSSELSQQPQMIRWKYLSFWSLKVFQMHGVAVNQGKVSRISNIIFYCCKMIFNSSHNKSVPRNSRGSKPSLFLIASTINSISETSCTHPLSTGETNRCICRIETEFPKYLLTLLRLALFL